VISSSGACAERQWLYLPVDTLPTATIAWTLSDLATVASVGPLAGSSSRPVIPWSLASSGSAGDANAESDRVATRAVWASLSSQ
jgi:hypothetical protein